MTTQNETEIVGESSPIEQYHYFTTGIYKVEKPEFLDSAKIVSDEYLDHAKKLFEPNKINPNIQTSNFFDDRRISGLTDCIYETSWKILSDQGYDMKLFDLQFLEFWAHEYGHLSSQEQHIHGAGCQISGVYFLDCPEECSRILFHDPRPSKNMINLPESNVQNATYASSIINFVPTPGTIMLWNSWLPHEISRNVSTTPFKFIHFNIGVKLIEMEQNKPIVPTEII